MNRGNMSGRTLSFLTLERAFLLTFSLWYRLKTRTLDFLDLNIIFD